MLDESLIAKYLEGTLSQEETGRLYAWVKEAPENKEFLMGIKETYLTLRYKGDASLADTPSQWRHLRARLGLRHRKRILGMLAGAVGVAASLLVGVLVGFRSGADKQRDTFLSMGSLSHIETAAGESVSITAPDGTRITLCPCSWIEYDPTHWEKERTIMLRGKAFFDVAKDAVRSFVVSTPYFSVLAHGTSFVISAYPEDKTSSVALQSGSVSIDLFKDGSSTRLLPNYSFVYDALSGEYVVQTSEKKDEQWNMVVFENESLLDKREDLKRKFGYTFIVPDSCAGLTYRASVGNESLGEFLSILEGITPKLHARIDRNEKTVTFYLSSE